MIIEEYVAIARALTNPIFPVSSTLAAFAVAAVVVTTTVCLHEVGHWGAARIFGIRGNIGFFVRRGTSKYWFLSVFGVRYHDSDFHKMTPARIRWFAAAGPLVDVPLSLLCLYGGHLFAGPSWVGIGVTLGGALYLALTPLNWFPIRAIRNDGYIVLRPQAISDQR
ncbi:site-2 protease family protein [Paraburkholderia fungorum]|uniref:site-2 protease family protein n=1 Tax=Paraburkholderia fungorum TaxID=134537 RepID=UPI00402BDB43